MSHISFTTCDSCGSIRDANDTFCGSCGRQLDTFASGVSSPTITPGEVKQREVTSLSNHHAYTPQPSRRSQRNRRNLLLVVTLVTIVIGVGGFELGQVVQRTPQGMIGKRPGSSNAANASSNSTLTPALTPTHALTISTEAPLSDGRPQAFRSFTHEHWIESRWIENGQWTLWIASDYPPSEAGVVGLSAHTQNNITYLIVSLDDGTCWQQHKLTTSSVSGWSQFYQC